MTSAEIDARVDELASDLLATGTVSRISEARAAAARLVLLGWEKDRKRR